MERFQHILATIPHTSTGRSSASWSSDEYVVRSVRMDARVLEVCNLIHAYLGREGMPGKGEEMRLGSEWGVRKGLKVLAFYSQLSPSDKQLSSQLFKQLELLPNWTTLAVQRVGSFGGPPSAEFEVSTQELEWLTASLEQSSFYSSLSAARLQEICVGRGLVLPISTSSVPASTFDLSAPYVAAAEDACLGLKWGASKDGLDSQFFGIEGGWGVGTPGVGEKENFFAGAGEWAATGAELMEF